jgi:hypothetical protein
MHLVVVTLTLSSKNIYFEGRHCADFGANEDSSLLLQCDESLSEQVLAF